MAISVGTQAGQIQVSLPRHNSRPGQARALRCSAVSGRAAVSTPAAVAARSCRSIGGNSRRSSNGSRHGMTQSPVLSSETAPCQVSLELSASITSGMLFTRLRPVRTSVEVHGRAPHSYAGISHFNRSRCFPLRRWEDTAAHGGLSTIIFSAIRCDIGLSCLCSHDSLSYRTTESPGRRAAAPRAPKIRGPPSGAVA